MNPMLARAIVSLALLLSFVETASANGGPPAPPPPVSYERLFAISSAALEAAEAEAKTATAFGAEQVLDAARQFHASMQRARMVTTAKWDEFMGEAIMAALMMKDVRDRAEALGAALEDRSDFPRARALWRGAPAAVAELNVSVAVATTQPGQPVFVPGQRAMTRGERIQKLYGRAGRR